jgi:nucleoside-diphosphate-sugar epimerase
MQAMPDPSPFLLVFGLGYTGAAIAGRAAADGWRVAGTSRDAGGIGVPPGVEVLPFDLAATAIAVATHVVATAPPGELDGDPVLARYRGALAAAPRLCWAGYLSTTGVYGDRGGGWVDEDTPPAPGAERTRRRVAAERDWTGLAGRIAVDLFRVAGIYGPGRSALEDVRAGTARRIVRPGHPFGRIHRDDIARAVLAAAAQACLHLSAPAATAPAATGPGATGPGVVPPGVGGKMRIGPGVRVLHLADDLPAESAAVIEEAARLLGVAPPPAVPYEQAVQRMTPIAASFWAECRRVSNARTKAALGIEWLYPSYKEGLRAILAG